MNNTFRQQEIPSNNKPENHTWVEGGEKRKDKKKNHESTSENREENNSEKSNKFVENWEKKFLSNPNISHEEMEEFADTGLELWNLKFNDDDKYFGLKKRLKAEQEKSPYITKEHEDLAMQIIQTTRGNLESTKKFIDYKFEESQKNIEEKELQEARAKVYGYPNDYEEFDPEAELKNINKFTEGEKQMTKEEKLNLKKSRLEEYKQRLAEQKIGMTKINSELESVISDGKDMNRDNLEKFLAEKARKCKLSKKQFDKYREVFEEAQKRNAIIKEFSQKYNGKQGEFFEAMFGKKPFGKIDIEPGAISFSVICEDTRDYAWVNSNKFKYTENDFNLDESDLKYGQSTGGHVLSGGTKIKELRNYVTAINASSNRSKYDKLLENTVIHEEKHEINDLINNVFSKEFRHDLKSNEERAKDEILAFFKDGSDVELIKFYLMAKENEGGHYDYLEKDRRHFQSLYDAYARQPEYANNPYINANLKEIEKRLKKGEDDKKTYDKHISDALNNIEKLEILSFSKGEIIGLFQTENLDKWGKVYERIKDSSDFQKKKSDLISNLDEEIRKTENSLDIFENELKEIEQYRNNQEKLSGFSKFIKVLFRKPEEAILARKDPELSKRQITLNKESLKKLLVKRENFKSF